MAGTVVHNLTLLAGNTTVANGPWILLAGLRNPSVQVDGIVAGDIVQLQGTNDDDPNAVGAAINQIGADVTVDSLLNVDPGPRWIRARRSDISGSGTVGVKLSATEYH